MKQLKIYKDTDGYTIQRINEFGHSSRRVFFSEEGLLEGLDAYSQEQLSEYDIQVSGEDGLWALVLNHLSK
jgi:hypothetical protein